MNTINDVIQAAVGTVTLLKASTARRIVLIIGAKMALTVDTGTQQFQSGAAGTVIQSALLEVTKSSDQASAHATEITIQHIELG